MTSKASSQSITSPDCGRDIPLTEAVAQQIAEPVLARKMSELRREIGEEVSAAYDTDLRGPRASRRGVAGRPSSRRAAETDPLGGAGCRSR